MIDAFNAPPTPGRIGRAAWRAGKHLPVSGMEISRQFLSPGDGVLDETFRDERLKTALAWMGSQSGPPMSEPGTAGHLGWSAMLHAPPTGAPRRRFRRAHGSARAPAAAPTADACGSETRARSIEAERRRGERRRHAPAANACAPKPWSSACHVLTTLELARDALPAALTERAQRAIRVGNGIGVALRLGTSALPGYPDAPADVHSGPRAAGLEPRRARDGLWRLPRRPAAGRTSRRRHGFLGARPDAGTAGPAHR